MWDIVNYRDGTITFHPLEVDRAMFGGQTGLLKSRQDELRFAISYRYGTLGGSRTSAGQTDLGGTGTVLQSSDTDTPTVSVADASRLPTSGGGAVVLLVGDEYIRATVDAEGDEITVIERAVRGTNVDSHDAGDRIQFTPGAFRKAVANRAGMGLIQSGRYSAFMPDSEDAIDKGDMLQRMKETWDTTIEALG